MYSSQASEDAEDKRSLKTPQQKQQVMLILMIQHFMLESIPYQMMTS